MQDFEKLGSFYMGKAFDLEKGKRTDSLVLYDSKDLVTHAVCVGMTGSGKTGLCLGLLEEAAIDNIPALIIDPKGDLGNLMLTFPQLRAQDFRPWINESDAQTKGLSPDQFAQQQAELWAKGLGEWGQSGDRIAKLRAAADVAIYTPGSNAGLSVSIVKSFDAPAPEIIDDAELLRERISTTVSSLLGLVGVNADPVKSREHILLSTILGKAWTGGVNLDLGAIIQQVQSPPFSRVGVLELEGFYPSKERFELAMTLNNLLAAPGFSAWMEGQPLDIASMLYTPSGKPRLAIVSIAHLGDAERMFFVSLLLNQLLGWVRSQSGTTSLRAILYMDEVAGYLPPIANPPSKAPMLTLMKQGRAFGLGVVLATQNPVDLDYKSLSNAGTWFIGRLQTEQDKARLLDGLAGAIGTGPGFDRASMDRTLSRLSKRVFLLHNVHEQAPEVFETRWTLSYLRGPITRQQIKQLMDPLKAGAGGGQAAVQQPAQRASGSAAAGSAAGLAPGAAAPTRASAGASASGGSSAGASSRPVLPPDVPQYFLPVRSAQPAGTSLVYEPTLLAFAGVRLADNKLGVDADEKLSMMTRVGDGPVAANWEAAEQGELEPGDVEKSPQPGAAFAQVHPLCAKAKSYADWTKDAADAIFRTHSATLWKSPSLEEVSKPGESEKDFRLRLAQVFREQRDAKAEKLRAKYAPKLTTLQERVRRAQQQVEAQKGQATSSKVNAALSFGAAILGGFLGRKVVSAGNISKAATAMRSAGRTMQESGDVQRAEETVEALQQQLADLDAQFKAEVDAAGGADPATEVFEKLTLRPKKTNIDVKAVVLAWAPSWSDSAGRLAPAWA